jgi:hypothetical protein
MEKLSYRPQSQSTTNTRDPTTDIRQTRTNDNLPTKTPDNLWLALDNLHKHNKQLPATESTVNYHQQTATDTQLTR